MAAASDDPDPINQLYPNSQPQITNTPSKKATVAAASDELRLECCIISRTGRDHQRKGQMCEVRCAVLCCIACALPCCAVPCCVVRGRNYVNTVRAAAVAGGELLRPAPCCGCPHRAPASFPLWSPKLTTNCILSFLHEQDVACAECPLLGSEEALGGTPAALFCVFDGHCGRAAADAASTALPDEVSKRLAGKLPGPLVCCLLRV